MAAFWAGKIPKKRPTETETSKPTMTDQGVTEAGRGVAAFTRKAINRNLDTMAVDINVTKKLRPLVPPGHIVVSESGIKGRGDIEKLREWGIDAVLIGEALVTADDVAAKIKELF